jgi:2-polyprenyl-6-methoxyphenol hydroxylase-like FAD-dependent oxidoreductase
MGRIVVCGGAVVGLTAAMMLAGDGHDVVVLESDGAASPEEAIDAWTQWDRRGVAQFHQPHNLFPRFREVVDEELPGLTGHFEAAGCVWIDPTATLPPGIQDRTRRPGDDRFRFVTGRRPVFEAVIASAAAETPRVEIRRGARVAGLTSGASVISAPHVTGVRLTTGEELLADLVVDATGRRSKLGEWLTGIGADPLDTDSEDFGFVYYTRYYTGPTPPVFTGPPLSELGSISLLTLLSDNDTWSLTIYGMAADTALKGLNDPAKFTEVIKACPLHAHWLDGTPTSDVLSMAGIHDRYRRFVVDGRPVATGVCAVGDAWACTNPSAGRGVSVGLVQAQQLRVAVRAGPDDPVRLALAYHESSEAEAAPFVRDQLANDRVRIEQMTAIREGRPVPPPDVKRRAFAAGMSRDPEIFRAALEARMCLAPMDEIVGRPGMTERVLEYAEVPAGAVPGPDRDALLELLA